MWLSSARMSFMRWSSSGDISDMPCCNWLNIESSSCFFSSSISSSKCWRALSSIQSYCWRSLTLPARSGGNWSSSIRRSCASSSSSSSRRLSPDCCPSSSRRSIPAPASDWYALERRGVMPPSGDGNGFGTRYADDFGLYAQYGLTHHRLSIEWARIEPEEGRRDAAAVEHYLRVLSAAHDAGVSPWV